jgi:hypothetical protein
MLQVQSQLIYFHYYNFHTGGYFQLDMAVFNVLVLV